MIVIDVNYFQDVKDEYIEWLKNNQIVLDEIIIKTFLLNEKLIEDLNHFRVKKREYKLSKTMGRIPNDVYNKMSTKQRGLVSKWQKHLYRGDYLINRSLRELNKSQFFKEIETLKKKDLEESFKLQLLSIRKLHLLGFYDASIICCGRFVEKLLKKQLNSESIKFENKWSLSRLFNTFRSKCKHPKSEDRIVESIHEIIRILRNTYAHDNVDQPLEEESNLAWHSLLFLIELLY